MNCSFATRNAAVAYSTRLVNPQDPAVIMDVTLVRHDGQEYSIQEFFGTYKVTHLDSQWFFNSSAEVDAFLRTHSLPTIKHMDDKVHEIRCRQEEDSMEEYYSQAI